MLMLDLSRPVAMAEPTSPVHQPTPALVMGLL